MRLLHKHPDLKACLILTLIVLGATLPFLNHAYHIDEPLFLRIAQQIKEDFWNPYGFVYLWHLDIEPMHKIAAFPPLFPYYLALVSWNYIYPPEWMIHLSLIPFSLLAVISFYILARQFDFSSQESFLAAALFSLSPAFVLTANMALPDVATVSLVLTALTLSLKGWSQKSAALPVLGGVFLGIAVLLRYNALPLLFISFFLGLTVTSLKKALIPTAVGLILLSLWLIGSSQTEGQSHVQGTLLTFANLNEIYRHVWAMGHHLTLSTLLPLLAVLLIFPKNFFFWFLLACFVSLNFALFASKSGQVIHFQLWPDILFFAFGALTFLYLGFLCFRDLKDSKFWSFQTEKSASTNKLILDIENLDEEKKMKWQRIIFFVWILSVLAIPLFYIHFSSKFLLLALPPLILILLKELHSRKKIYLKLSFAVLPLLATLSFVITSADFSFANIYREKALKIFESLKPLEGNVWFTGHWGWQYYIEQRGGIPLPWHLSENTTPAAGDFLITTESCSPQHIDEDFKYEMEFLSAYSITPATSLRTIHHSARAGFYSDNWGPLPFGFSVQPIETFRLYRVLD